MSRLSVAVLCLLPGCSGRHDTLAPGLTTHAEVARAEPFSVRVVVPANQAARLVVDQHHHDLVVTATSPAGARSRTVDMRERGIETVTLIGEADGAFIITIQRKAVLAPAATVSAARFDVRLEGPPHPVSARDRQMQAAENSETAGKALATGPLGTRGNAIEPLQEALRLWTQAGDPMGQATTLARIGDRYYAATQFAQAESYYTRALVLLRPLGQPYQLAVIENNLGGCDERRGRFAVARAHFKAALDLWATLMPDAEGDMAVTLVNEGAMLVQYGDYEAAIERFLKAIPVLERLGSPMRVPALNNMGAAYQAVGDRDGAHDYFTRALAALPGNDPRRFHLQLRLAQVALDRGDAPRAETTVREGLEAIRSSRPPPPIPNIEADTLSLLARTEAANGRLEAALVTHDQAMTLYRNADVRRGIANTLHHTGAIKRRLGRLASARKDLTDALALHQEIGLRDAEAETRYEIGLLEEQTGGPQRAQAQFTRAIEIVEDVRGRVGAEYSRTAYFAARQKYFAAQIDSLMGRRGRPRAADAARAFEVAERERARALIDLLRESGTDLRRGVDATLLERERDAQRLLDFWANQRARLVNVRGARTAADDALAQMQASLTTYREIDGLIHAAAARDPSVTSPPIITLPQIQRDLLDTGTRLIRYSLGERRSFAWLVAPRGVEVAVLPPRDAIERLARSVAEAARAERTPQTARERRERFERDAAALGTMLLGPFARALADHRLLIVGEGALQFVPFSALPEPGQQTPLIVRHEIAMLPSASAIIALRQRAAGRAPPPKTLAVMADAVYERDDPRLARLLPASAGASSGEAGPEFPRLMLSRAEAEAILPHVQPEARFVAFNFDADRETALTQLGGYRIVHFAAHAVPDSVRPELSALILSTFDAQGRRRLGHLRLHDITTGMSLRAEVVVLSACSTAIGRDVPGEGLMGLARGFFGAGAASVVGSLSTVQEEPTLELMKVLYDEMLGARRLRPAAALQAAQIRMIEHPRFGDPFYWSPFVFMGDPR